MILKFLIALPAFAGEGTGHSHGPEFSGTQLVGAAIIAVLALGVMYFLSKKMK